ncbi:hypothetical protein FRB99_007002 [Tulasnella sp. 403]|nr:hypothetical protein FRB99_007002 [Tulasnella sp. 403]
MTANDDIERAPANETTALLHQESGPNYKADTTPPELAQQDGQPVTSVETKWNRVGLIWRAVAVASGVVLLVLAVQGWRNVDKGFDWAGSFKKALGGGLSGAAAMVLQVLVLMPLRTVMNYQYRYGTSTKAATLTLWYDGGFGRYYQGLGAALIQGPAARFGDTFANALVLALLHSNETLKNIPIFLQTALASISAAAFRVLLTPIDTVKTTLQTEGSRGIGVLKRRMKNDGVKTLWFGALATAAATFVGHYPWFFVVRLFIPRYGRGAKRSI